MNSLTNFQEIAGMALDIEDNEAAKIQKAWPATERDLRKALRQWKTITNSKIKGFELLSACGKIWRYKPTDLAEIEGRKILYHPVDGNPIPERAPLDGLSWEMLAFLNWSLQIGHLQWSDEVVIAREIKEAGGLINDLPSDRFYAKAMLPRNSDGGIDWSDVGLAKAKASVVSGKILMASTAEPVEAIYHDKTTLAGVLALIPALIGSQDARNHLLIGLPPGPSGCIRRPPAPGPDLYNIVEAAEGFGRLSNGRMAVDVVIDNAMRLVRGTALATKLETFRVEH